MSVLIIISVVVIGLTALVYYQFFKEDNHYKYVKSIPDGLIVECDPSRVKAVMDESIDYKYAWYFTTTVSSKEEPIEIVEFGAFGWDGRRWIFSNHTGLPFTSSDFEDWYSCKDATLIPDKKYSDQTNWSGSNFLRESKSLWYFIGKKSNGSLVKGMAIVENMEKVGAIMPDEENSIGMLSEIQEITAEITKLSHLDTFKIKIHNKMTLDGIELQHHEGLRKLQRIALLEGFFIENYTPRNPGREYKFTRDIEDV